MAGDAREPRYYRLKRHLIDLTATMPPGSALPPERTLAAQFDTSRTTVRQALQELLVEGRLERIQGKGTFVASDKLEQRLTLSSYTEHLAAQGITPSSRLLDVRTVRADPATAARLELDRGARVLAVRRLRLANDLPMAIEQSFLDRARFPDLARQLRSEPSLYALLRTEYGVVPAHAEQTIETAMASPDEAALLGTETGLSVLLLTRHAYDQAERPFEWVRAVYRGDRYRLVTTLTPP
jgi:GntR family transcriptional regulator